jgi:hypothetical protein
MAQLFWLQALVARTASTKKYGHAWIENDLRRFNDDGFRSRGFGNRLHAELETACFVNQNAKIDKLESYPDCTVRTPAGVIPP